MPKEIDHIGELKPDPRNLRKHTPRNIGMVVDALHEVGFARSIVIDEENTVLAGNGVLDACGEAGITKLRVVEADGEEVIAVRRKGLTPTQKTRLAAFDNAAGTHSMWDADALDALAAEEFDFSGIFSDDELAELLSEAGETKTRESTANEGPKRPGSATLRPVVTMEQARTFETALRRTGLANRAAAFEAVCAFYVERHAEPDAEAHLADLASANPAPPLSR